MCRCLVPLILGTAAIRAPRSPIGHLPVTAEREVKALRSRPWWRRLVREWPFPEPMASSQAASACGSTPNHTSSSLDGLAYLVKNLMQTGRHRSHLRRGRTGLCQCRLC
jgi:hypothetical protein